MVELGFPFSDPLADGPVIRRAGERALAQGMRTARCLECLAETRARVDVPLVPMTYASIFEAYGWERFERDARAAGATSLIVADLPVRRATRSCGASSSSRRPRPTSGSRLAAAATDGWLYLVTVTGTTGARAELAPTLAPLAERARARHRRCRSTPASASRRRACARGGRARRRRRRRLARGRGRRAGRRRAVGSSSARSAPRSTHRKLIAHERASVPCRMRPGGAGHLRPRRDDRETRGPRRAKRRRTTPSWSSSPRRSCPSIRRTAGRASSQHGSEGAKLWARLAQQSVEIPSPAPERSAPPHVTRRVDRGRRQRARTRHALQHASDLRAGRQSRPPPPQARAHEPRAAGLGPGRRRWPRHRRHRRRARSAG